jgi:hypothetical protein
MVMLQVYHHAWVVDDSNASTVLQPKPQSLLSGSVMKVVWFRPLVIGMYFEVVLPFVLSKTFKS